MLRTSNMQPEQPTDADCVRFMSLHKAKDLIPDLVVVLGCVEGLTPYAEESPPHAGQTGMIEEQWRLFHVASTRSRDTLILSSAMNLPRHFPHPNRVRIVASGQTDSAIVSRLIEELDAARPNHVNDAQLLATRVGA